MRPAHGENSLTPPPGGWHTHAAMRRTKAALFQSFAVLGAGTLLFPAEAFACAVCGLDGDPGYFWSLLFLMGMPFAVAGAVGGIFAYNFRNGRGKTGEDA